MPQRGRELNPQRCCCCCQGCCWRLPHCRCCCGYCCAQLPMWWRQVFPHSSSSRRAPRGFDCAFGMHHACCSATVAAGGWGWTSAILCSWLAQICDRAAAAAAASLSAWMHSSAWLGLGPTASCAGCISPREHQVSEHTPSHGMLCLPCPNIIPKLPSVGEKVFMATGCRTFGAAAAAAAAAALRDSAPGPFGRARSQMGTYALSPEPLRLLLVLLLVESNVLLLLCPVVGSALLLGPAGVRRLPWQMPSLQPNRLLLLVLVVAPALHAAAVVPRGRVRLPRAAAASCPKLPVRVCHADRRSNKRH